MNSHFPASQNSNYSSLQRDKWIYLESQFAVQTHTCTMKCLINDDESMIPSIFFSQSMGFDIFTKHKRKDKQSSVIFNKRSLAKGRKQNLSSVYATCKRNSSVELLRESNEKNQPLDTENLNENITKNHPLWKKKKKNQEKKNQNKWEKTLHTLTEAFCSGKNGKINKRDNCFAVFSMNQTSRLLDPKPPPCVWEGCPKDIRMTPVSMGGVTSLPRDFTTVSILTVAALHQAYSPLGSSQCIQIEGFWQVGGYHGTKP